VSKITIISKLSQYLTEWQTTAEQEGVPVETIQVDLVSVLYDFCLRLGVDPHSVLGDIAGVLE
jgi:hypothetical protein